MSSSVSQVPAEERQVNLLLALRHTRHGMSATEVISRVCGYDPDGGDRARRMFERDKDVLRSIGVPLVVESVSGEPCYRVDEDHYVLPPLRLEAADVAALELAAFAWRDGTLPQPARRALTKLLAVAPARTGDEVLPDLSIDLAGQDVPAVLLTAVEERRLVSFDYLSARTGTVRHRIVEPHGLRLSEGAWYLDARDTRLTPASGTGPTNSACGAGSAAGPDDGHRVFRLARLRGEVSVVSGPGAFAPDLRPEAGGGARATAVLALAPGRAHALRRRGREPGARPRCQGPEGWDVVAVAYEDLMVLAGSLAALADAVVVLEPETLREAVLDHLRGAAALAQEQER
ncbi:MULTISPECIES: WYL domain-containing protein [unclassified Actinomyces]|uniref:helix-turn-helix transcriptional regulator n=3 Tax=Actinomyces TaxID=1654 RepID=UPI002892AF1F|nr:WYL domain-containing protein [Actinomyces sp. 187325]